jgi:outer membrane protein assembly factor BamB
MQSRNNMPSALSPALFHELRHPIAALVLAATATLGAATTEPIASSEAGWPQFRGPRRDGVSDETNLLQTWPETGPALAWSTQGIGRGYSSPVIADGRLFITGDADAALQIFAFDLKGRKLWQATNGKSWTGEFPGARASAAASGGRLYHMNAHGRIACFDAATGKEQWSVDLIERFKGKNITWALSECLLVDDRAVYVTAGGSDALAVALDAKSGEVIWKSEPLKDAEDGAVESPSYASPILLRFAGRRLLIGVSLRNLFCVDADSGKLQWASRFPTSYSVLASMPALVGDGVFMTAPHGKRGRLLRLTPPANADAPVGIEEVWTTKLDTCQGGVLHVNSKLFGSFYGPRQGWAAVDARTGDIIYQAPEIIKGSAVYANRRLYVLSEDGVMHLLEAGDAQFSSRGRFRVAETKNDAWAHPVIHAGRMYLRYHDALFCYDIRSAAAE